MDSASKRVCVNGISLKEYDKNMRDNLIFIGKVADKIMLTYPVYSLIFKTVSGVKNINDDSIYSIFYYKKCSFIALLKKSLINRYYFNDREIIAKKEGLFNLSVSNENVEANIYFTNNMIKVFIYKSPYFCWCDILKLKFN